MGHRRIRRKSDPVQGSRTLTPKKKSALKKEIDVQKVRGK